MDVGAVSFHQVREVFLCGQEPIVALQNLDFGLKDDDVGFLLPEDRNTPSYHQEG